MYKYIVDPQCMELFECYTLRDCLEDMLNWTVLNMVERVNKL